MMSHDIQDPSPPPETKGCKKSAVVQFEEAARALEKGATVKLHKFNERGCPGSSNGCILGITPTFRARLASADQVVQDALEALRTAHCARNPAEVM